MNVNALNLLISRIQKNVTLLFVALTKGEQWSKLPEWKAYKKEKMELLVGLQLLSIDGKKLKTAFLGLESALRLKDATAASVWGDKVVQETIAVLEIAEKRWGKETNQSSTVRDLQRRLAG